MHRVSAVIPARDEAGNPPHVLPTIPRRTHEAIRVDGQSADRTATWASDEVLLRRVSVVIPTLNEADCIAHVLARIPTSVREVIVVDGLSTDGTADVAAAARLDVRVVHQQVRGKGAAIRAGVEAASGDYIVLMDGDGSTDPAYISAFARVLAGGADYAKASRFLPGAGTDDMPFHRRVGSWLFVQLARVLFGTHFTDITYGYNAVRRDKRGAMALEIDGWAQEIVTNIRMVRYGMRVEELPAFEPRRIAGVAKLQTWSAGWTILRAILAERRHPLAGLGASAQPSSFNSGRPSVAVTVHGSRDVDPWLRELSGAGPGRLAAHADSEPDEPAILVR
jgi:Glycosyl transferase family 2